MTNLNLTAGRPFNTKSFALRASIGAAIGLVLISFFVFGVDNPKPEWGTSWQAKPLLLTPIFGAISGACYYFLHYLSAQRGCNKVATTVIGIIGFTVGLWLGVVIGLNGTMWN